MIRSHIYLITAYVLVILILLTLAGFYLWRNISLSRRIRQIKLSADMPQISRRRLVLLRFLPFCCFAGLVGLFLAHLLSDRHQGDGQQGTAMQSTFMVGHPAPVMHLPLLDGQDNKQFTLSDLQGRVSVVNFWATWCVPCRLEHPFLMQLARDGRFDVIGINYKDRPDDARQFLQKLKNPFRFVALDRRGRTAIDWGVYGVPETYLVDGQGVIIHHHIGPLDAQALQTTFLPAIERILP